NNRGLHQRAHTGMLRGEPRVVWSRLVEIAGQLLLNCVLDLLRELFNLLSGLSDDHVGQMGDVDRGCDGHYNGDEHGYECDLPRSESEPEPCRAARQGFVCRT